MGACEFVSGTDGGSVPNFGWANRLSERLSLSGMRSAKREREQAERW